jgi:hypothetical protein
MRYAVSLLALGMILLGTGLAALAAEETAAPPGEAKQPVVKERPLTPEEKEEKEARKACKIEICFSLATKDPEGADVACDIIKTWREEDIVKMLGGHINWPFGKAVCQSKLRLKRAPLAKAMSEPDYAVTMESETVRCSLDRKEGKPYVVEIALAPKVTFKNGKATDADVNWGDVSAPMLIYPLLYAGAALDNSANVLGPEVVRMVNEFTTKGCAEVKDGLPSAKANEPGHGAPGPASP